MTPEVAAASVPARSSRLLSVDLYRGLAVAAMLLVDHQGREKWAYRQLRHTEWNGWTAADLIFPSFLFLVGVSILLSVSARRARGATAGEIFRHAAVRAALLVVIGILCNGFPLFDVGSWRLPGVVQRIGLCYLPAVALALWTRPRTQLAITAAILLGYWALLRLVPVPGLGLPGRDFPFLDPERNLAAWLDRTVVPGRLYDVVRDPEGLLTTLPAIATTVLGLLAGRLLRPAGRGPDVTRGDLAKANPGALVLAGISAIALGQLWGLWFPINKNLWTSSFTLLTAGVAMVVLAAFYWAVEIRHWRGPWTMPLLVFGLNALLGFVLGAVIWAPMHYGQARGADGASVSWQTWLINWLQTHLGPANTALAYAVGIMMACWLLLLPLYRRRLFLKL